MAGDWGHHLIEKRYRISYCHPGALDVAFDGVTTDSMDLLHVEKRLSECRKATADQFEVFPESFGRQISGFSPILRFETRNNGSITLRCKLRWNKAYPLKIEWWIVKYARWIVFGVQHS
jgi:hypothetical protein